MEIIVLSWHPVNSKYYTAGGFKRSVEIAKRAPKPIVIIDKHPSIFKSLKNSRVRILEYGKYFDLKFLAVVHPVIYDFIQRIVSAFQILTRLLTLTPRPGIIYVPFSEHVHLTLAAVLAKLFFGCRVVLCNLNVNIFFGEKPINTFLHRFADDIITISNSLKSKLKKTGIYPNHVNGVGFEKPKFAKRSTQNKKYDAIFIGRHTQDKGFFDLLEIWQIVKDKYKKSLLLIAIGNVPKVFKPKIEQKIKKYQLEKSIKILGEISESEKIKSITQSKVMVFPSKQEGWGIAPMEALSLGLPVIAYDLPVYEESIGRTEALRTVGIGDIENFARMFINTLDGLEIYSNLAKQWKPKLSWNDVAEREWRIISQD